MGYGVSRGLLNEHKHCGGGGGVKIKLKSIRIYGIWCFFRTKPIEFKF